MLGRRRNIIALLRQKLSMFKDGIREWRIRKARFELEKSRVKRVKDGPSRLTYKSVDLINDILRDFGHDAVPPDLAAELSTEVVFCWKEIQALVQMPDAQQVSARLREILARVENANT